MWGTAYVMGAGVVIGPAVTISPFVAVTAPTQLPPFPLLAALPQGATPLAWALPLTGVAAGVLAGLVIARRARRESRLVRLALATGAAAVAGVLLALGAFLASGSLGDLRLAFLGPLPTTVGDPRRRPHRARGRAERGCRRPERPSAPGRRQRRPGRARRE